MRRMVLVALVAAVVLAGCSAQAPASSPPAGGAGGASASATVQIKGFAFQPATVEVAAGGTVTWTNADAATHAVKGQGRGQRRPGPSSVVLQHLRQGGHLPVHVRRPPVDDG